MKVGFFDSGIGGLSVLHCAQRAIPDGDFLYYADSDHAPYGEKTEAEVCKYVFEAVAFLVENGADAIVLACNTATSVAIAKLRSRYNIPIIGMEPAVKRALDLSSGKRILVTGTPITLKGNKLRHLIGELDAAHIVDLLPLPGLVKFAERGVFVSGKVTEYLKHELAPYDMSRYSAVVLGCTHFNYFKDTLSAILPPHIRFIDGNEGTVRQLIRRLGITEGTEGIGSTKYFISGREVNGETLEQISTLLLRLDEMVNIL